MNSLHTQECAHKQGLVVDFRIWCMPHAAATDCLWSTGMGSRIVLI